VLRANDKSVLARGRRHGRAVVIKVLRTDEEFWQAKFDHEIRIYRALAERPPPVRVPELLHTDGHRVLVIEYVPGDPVDTERYPSAPLPESVLDAVLDTVSGFGGWSPPPGALAPVFIYPARLRRYHAAGFFTDADHEALSALLRAAPPAPAWPANHGDPLPANVLLAERGGCVLLDFEFTGLFLPGFDLAVLHTLLADTPGAQTRIDTMVNAAGIETSFLINQAMVLSREMRLHIELPDGEFRTRRLALLHPQWATFQTRLHVYMACETDRRQHAGRPWYADHPKNIWVREDALIAAVHAFFTNRILGPDRRQILDNHLGTGRAELPTDHGRRREQLAKQVADLRRRQQRLIEELEDDNDDLDEAARRVYRASIRDRFTDLTAKIAHAEKERSEDRSAKVDGRTDDPALLDALPQLRLNLPTAPQQLQRALYEAFDLKIIYNGERREAKLRVTITADAIGTLTSTINAVADRRTNNKIRTSRAEPALGQPRQTSALALIPPPGAGLWI
jgi:Phosphotransferase enzyme family